MLNPKDFKLGTLIKINKIMKMIPITQQVNGSRSKPFSSLLLRGWGHLCFINISCFIRFMSIFNGRKTPIDFRVRIQGQTDIFHPYLFVT